ncbi:hypothetical protein [Viridibacillus arvi]|uniref:hypothetical protein n=1 Tax=Viridibacillus arvi TaxID=263475 RepID=UPI0034CD56B6
MTSKIIINDTKAIAENLNLKQKYKGITKKELILILTEHADHIDTMEQWGEYARINTLPSLYLIIKHFSSFNNMKRELAIGNINRWDITKEELILILTEHADHIDTVEQWREYASIHALPSVDFIIKHFSSFNNMKKELEIGTINRSITKKELILILTEHAEYLNTTEQWSKFASIHALPSLPLIIKHFSSFNNMKKELAIGNINYINRGITKEELIIILKEHTNYLNTMGQWSKYAKKHALPSLYLIIKHFSSFNNMKKEMAIDK